MPPRFASDRGKGPRGGPNTRGRGAARGGVPVAIEAPVKTVKTIGVKRPGYGTGGKAVKTIVNAFPVETSNGVIYHYDVVVDPEKLPAVVNMELFERLQTVFAPDVFTPPAVYDGRKNAFTTHKLNLGPNDSISATFNVTRKREGPPPKNPRPPKVYRITLTKVAEINTEIMHQFINEEASQDNAILTSIMALNVVIRMGPNCNPEFTFNSRSFFTKEGRQLIGGGMELWRGFFQSIRPSQARMYLNIDIMTGIMFKEGPLIQLCLEHLNVRDKDPNRLSQNRLSDRDRISLQRFLTNLQVSTNYGGRIQTRAIRKLTRQGANAVMFTMRAGGPSISVANYFLNELNRPLQYPELICIELGSGAKIPLELCTVPGGQMMRKQIPSDKTKRVVEFSQLRPEERLASIHQGLRVLAHGESDYVREFGMTITEEPIVVNARVIATPVLRYGQGSKEATIRPANGQWNMRDKKLFRPGDPVKHWFIVVYETKDKFNEATAKAMAMAFCEGAKSVGVQIEDRNPLIFWENPHGNIVDQLRKNGQASIGAKRGLDPTLIVVVLPDGGNHIYTAVKHFGDIKMGVATQCLKSKNCAGARLQYWANVMLKVNVKLGGINNVLENSPLNDPVNPTIVMGADVMHPAPGTEGRPSFAALVSSVDLTTAKYISCSRVQTGRQEIIVDLEGMVKDMLKLYNTYVIKVEKAKRAPARLIFYRDGVSEGQFQHVLDHELPMIKDACKAVGINPKITLIIVGKRHHIRMFPQNKRDADPKSGNCQAGTTIDEGIGHPTEFDYYQLTHGGLLGTSRPAHYSVLYDENNYSADAMQNMSFSLCHVYARATRSVSIPAPVYYADIVCSRAKHHYTPGSDLDLSETATQSSSQAVTQLEAYTRGYQQLNEKQTKYMYFM